MSVRTRATVAAWLTVAAALAGAPAWAAGTPAPLPSLSMVPAPTPVEVLPPAVGGSIPGGRIAAAVRRPLGDPAVVGHVGAVVLATDQHRLAWSQQGLAARAPASALKLLTGLAALDQIGPATRVPTRVVSVGRRQIVLVGGGDPTLTVAPVAEGPAPDRPASLTGLADRAARRLRAHGVHRVRLSYDTSAFTGPTVSPTWPAEYVTSGEIAPVTALMADEGRVSPTSDQRVSDPAAMAATSFAELLGARGVSVTAPVVQSSPTDRSGQPLATVWSPPASSMVQQMLRDSDNQVAESLGRLAATAAHRPASFRGAVATMLEVARDNGVAVGGWRLFDASGLSRGDRATALGLAQILDVAAWRPLGWSIVAGLPVAGFSGTLADRYLTLPQSTAAGIVRAKTGTLTGTSAEVGLVVTRSGHPWVFAFLAGDVPSSQTDAARSALDRAAAALASIG
jgi:D-alanyl-D-alanine carboxypeptidase/D-alanyl-D-alanine-endopeptidase (penicillin-binding protein 4)